MPQTTEEPRTQSRGGRASPQIAPDETLIDARSTHPILEHIANK